MDRRTHEGPMDFEYQNGTGPMDGRSPFAQISMNSQRNQANNDKKRTFSVFGSPSKPALPGLRDPASQPHFFSAAPPSPPKPLPSLPPNARNNPAFCTPRKLDVDDFASSGGETPKSPEHREPDSDATPEMQGLRGRFANLDNVSRPVFSAGGGAAAAAGRANGGVAVKEKEKRQSWWRGFSNSMRSSPGASSPLAQPSSKSRSDEYAHGAERRIRKRRDKERTQVALSRSARHDAATDSEADEHDRRAMSKGGGGGGGRKTSAQRHQQDDALSQQQQHQQPPPAAPPKPHWAFTLFDFITQHPTLPHILSFYAQLLLNLFLIGGIMYILYSFWSTIRSDVDKKSSEAVAELLAEMAACAQQYTANRCERATRVPAMEVVCSNWDKCMNQDPRNVGRARVSAHTFAEIFNGFIEPISYKAMIFSLILVFGAVGISNFAFSIFRDKAAAHAASQAQHHHYYSNPPLPPPPTPQRSFSGGGPEGGYWTPYGQQQQQQGLEPAPSFPAAGAGGNDGQSSPVRRLQFR
ncbi:hypothetical protein MBLNU459_g2136t1 [Dothideomycetes sp. NU459]